MKNGEHDHEDEVHADYLARPVDAGSDNDEDDDEYIDYWDDWDEDEY